MMHPIYAEKRKRSIIVGSILLMLGVSGALLPFVQGFIFVAAGLALLSPYVGFFAGIRTRLAVTFPVTCAKVTRYETKILNWLRLSPYVRTYTTVLNRDEVPLSVIVEATHIRAGTAIVLHSASGAKETHVTDTLSSRCHERGFSVVRFDAANGIGESGGAFTLFTTSSMLRDLEDMVAWARAQSWYQEPLVLVGHSIGATVALTYAARNPGDVAELLLFAPTVSGERYAHAYEQHNPPEFAAWKETGTRLVPNPLTGEREGISFGFVEDLYTYDLVEELRNIEIPTTILHGEFDRTTLRKDVEDLQQAMGSTTTIVPLPATRHTPLSPSEFHTLRHALAEWPQTS
jgi:pimeloyl-ACP methyl ester carboxylesterase